MAKRLTKQNPRATALDVIHQVVYQGHSLDQAFASQAKLLEGLDAREKSLAKALCFGVIRDWLQLRSLLAAYLSKPVRKKDQILNVVLALGAYQLLSMRVADHAALDQTVSLLARIGKTWAKGMVNAVLRAVQRDRDAQALKPGSAEANHPQWIVQRLQQDWPQHWQQVVAANDLQASLDLRCNQRFWSRAQALEALKQAGIDANEIAGVDCGIRLQHAVEVEQIPQFAQGGFSVQDAAAQFAAPLLAVQAQQRVLDACAAPGGKTAHILERYDVSELLAIDIDPQRLQRVEENLERLGLQAALQAQDAAKVADWWDGKAFDRILLDAPCSASGVIRRHPDIKLLRQDSDIAQLAALQQIILQQLWPSLKSGGILLYVTCSVFREENDNVIAAFVQNQAGVEPQPLTLSWGRATRYGWQILPGDNDSDGFYYACLKKHATTS